MKWTKESAVKELAYLVSEIDNLLSERRYSAAHTRWLTRTLTLLDDVFGINSRYYLTMRAFSWQRTETLILPPLTRDINGALEYYHQQAYQHQLDSAKGILQAALDQLQQVDNLAYVYEGKDTPAEASAILKIINLAEHKLRKVIRDQPKIERDVQDAFESLLIGADIEFKREKDRIEYSSKQYVPDFTFDRIDLALDFKLCTKDNAEKRIIGEINDYILAFRSTFSNVVFVVYDIGFIRDVDTFTGSFSNHENVVVLVIKH